MIQPNWMLVNKFSTIPPNIILYLTMVVHTKLNINSVIHQKINSKLTYITKKHIVFLIKKNTSKAGATFER